MCQTPENTYARDLLLAQQVWADLDQLPTTDETEDRETDGPQRDPA